MLPIRSLVAACATLLLPVLSHAATIQVAVETTVSSVPLAFGSRFSVGDPIRISFEYVEREPTVPGGSGISTFYVLSSGVVELQAAGLSFDLRNASLSLNEIGIFTFGGSVKTDMISVNDSSPSISMLDGRPISLLGLHLSSTGTIFEDPELVISRSIKIGPGPFDYRTVHEFGAALRYEEGSLSLSGDGQYVARLDFAPGAVSVVVPEPEASTLYALVAIALLWMTPRSEPSMVAARFGGEGSRQRRPDQTGGK